jgi:hypothetical protein
MNGSLFERLLFEEESPTLDFKNEQYRFAKSTDDEKSELLKDIVGFANSWRRSDAYILIGVEDVRGGRANVVGISQSDHLDDHSLQQFVNNLTNRPIRFHYEAFGYEGKQVGIIRIEEQQRPIHLRKDYGKLKKNEVYIRRGSSTDPSKPASIDEIAQMGRGAALDHASVLVEFACLDEDDVIGAQIDWNAEFCQLPDMEDIPSFDDTPRPVQIPGFGTLGLPSVSSFSMRDRTNPDYYRDFANYFVFQKFARKVRLVITNAGDAPAKDLRVEIVLCHNDGCGVVKWSNVPEEPSRRKSILQTPNLPDFQRARSFRPAGDVELDVSKTRSKIDIECGDVQPKRKVWTDEIYLWIHNTGELIIKGLAFAANLPQPQAFDLAISATISCCELSADEVVDLADQSGEVESDESCD